MQCSEMQNGDGLLKDKCIKRWIIQISYLRYEILHNEVTWFQSLAVFWWATGRTQWLWDIYRLQKKLITQINDYRGDLSIISVWKKSLVVHTVEANGTLHPVKFFSNLNLFLWILWSCQYIFGNINKYFSGWPNRYFGSNGNTAQFESPQTNCAAHAEISANECACVHQCFFCSQCCTGYVTPEIIYF